MCWNNVVRMNNRMSTLLQKMNVTWPVEPPTSVKTPAFEIVEDCVLLQNNWIHNQHIKIADFPDKTGFECFINQDHFTFDRTRNSLKSCLERAAVLQQGLLSFAKSRRFRMIVSISDEDPDCNIRFHQVRSGESWLSNDLEGYNSEAVLVFEV